MENNDKEKDERRELRKKKRVYCFLVILFGGLESFIAGLFFSRGFNMQDTVWVLPLAIICYIIVTFCLNEYSYADKKLKEESK